MQYGNENENENENENKNGSVCVKNKALLQISVVYLDVEICAVTHDADLRLASIIVRLVTFLRKEQRGHN